MEKRDYIWIAIRIFGIYLLVEAIVAILAVAGALLQIYSYSGPPPHESIVHLRNEIHAAAMTTVLRSLLAVLIYGMVGTYLTLGGKLVMRLICPPEEPKANG